MNNLMSDSQYCLPGISFIECRVTEVRKISKVLLFKWTGI